MKVIDRLLCPANYHCNFCIHEKSGQCKKDPRRMITYNSNQSYNDWNFCIQIFELDGKDIVFLLCSDYKMK